MAFDANDLSPHEHFVVERTRLGEIADLTPMTGPGGAKPVVRAGFIRKLMLELEPSWSVRTPGVRLRGARIEGALDLTDCSGAGGTGLPALALVDCEIPDAIDLSHARLARLSLERSRLTRLVAVEAQIDGEFNLCEIAPLDGGGAETLTARLRGLRVDGDLLANGAKFARAIDAAEPALMLQSADIDGNVLLTGGFEAFGAVTFYGASIGGTLDCSGSAFLNRSDDGSASAIILESARVDGDVLLRNGFRAEGEVWLMSAVIRGDVIANDGVLKNEFGCALLVNNAKIGGKLSAEGAKIAGQLALASATIGHALDLRAAEIAHRITPRGDVFGRAIDATSASIGNAALLEGANVKGEAFLGDARIGGDLAFGAGRFLNPGAWAIRAPNVRVGSNVSFKLPEGGYAPHGQKTVIEGGVTLERARIEGALSWSAVELRGPGPENSKGGVFSFADAVISGAVEAGGLTTHQDALIDASGATCAALDDDLKAGWGADGARLNLEGFAYGRIDGIGERWRNRLGWLKRATAQRFSPQPFSHAAQAYARAGRRDDARRILLAQHDLQTTQASAGPLTWLLSSLFGVTAGYGLAPMRAVRSLALFLALGVVGVLAMNAQGALVTPEGRACNGAIEPALYAIDVALPVIDLGQESQCAPGRTARAELSQGLAVSEDSDWRLFEGLALWRWAHAIYAVLGAILTALAVITFSGVMKPKDD